MKIGIVSDAHFGYRRFEEDSYTQGREALHKAAGECDVLLIAGDIFDARNPSLETFRNVFKLFRELESVKMEGACITDILRIPVAAIHGTHERRGKEEASPVALLQTLGYLVNVHNRTAIFESRGEKVAVSGMGGVPEDAAGRLIKELGCKPVDGAFNIFMFHQSVEELLPFGNIMSLEELPKGYDLYVCGHLHKNVYIEQYNLLIPGSTVVTQLRKEEAQAKGYYVYDTKERRSEFREINSRRFIFHEMEFSHATISDVRRAAEEAIAKLLLSDGKPSEKKPIIKLQLSGTLMSGHEKFDIDIKNDDSYLFVENSLETEALQAKIERIRELRSRNKSVRELCLDMLKEQLGQSPIDIEQFFNSLSSQAGADDSMELVKVIISNFLDPNSNHSS